MSRLMTVLMSQPRVVRIIRPAIHVLLGALILMTPVVLDGRPVVFADTNIYYWMGEMQFRPLRYALAPLTGGPSSTATDPEAADEVPAEMQLRRTEMAARSPWFGMLLYAVAGWGNLWWLTLLQSLAASLSVHALWRALRPVAKDSEWFGLMAGLAATSTLPFFAGFAMPDLWAGTGLAALATLLFLRDRLGWGKRAVLAGLVLASFAFHQSNGVIALAATILTGGLAWLAFRVSWRRLAPGGLVVIMSLAVSALLMALYVGAIRNATGETLLAPPFLAARVLADGPGRLYLRTSCAEGAHWALCRFSGLPLTDSQDILWSGNPRKGVFGLASVAERRRIDAEQTRFVLAVIVHDPVGVTAAALRNFGQAVVQVQLEDPLRDPHFYLTDPDWRDSYIADLVHALGDCGPAQTGCRPRFTQDQSILWHGGWFVAALVFIGWRMTRRDWRRGLADREAGTVTLTLVIAFFGLALLINAAVTGVLSGPFPRYQARIAWLAPAAALLLGAFAGWTPKGVGAGPDKV